MLNSYSIVSFEEMSFIMQEMALPINFSPIICFFCLCLYFTYRTEDDADLPIFILCILNKLI